MPEAETAYFNLAIITHILSKHVHKHLQDAAARNPGKTREMRPEKRVVCFHADKFLSKLCHKQLPGITTQNICLRIR